MLKLDQNQQLIIRCSDQYYSYDAYHITAEFFPEKVRAGLIRQETDPEMDTLVRITAAPRELFRFSVPETRTDRKQIKYEMGCSLCDALSELTGKKLPWGILTGVRPTKIARTWLEEGMDQKACIKRFQEELKTSPQRAELAVKVAEKEIELIDKIEAAGTDGLCIYVHIPFCPSRCLYCSFASVPADRFGDRIDAYLDALQKEMTAIALTNAQGQVSFTTSSNWTQERGKHSFGMDCGSGQTGYDQFREAGHFKESRGHPYLDQPADYA